MLNDAVTDAFDILNFVEQNRAWPFPIRRPERSTCCMMSVLTYNTLSTLPILAVCRTLVILSQVNMTYNCCQKSLGHFMISKSGLFLINST